MLPSLFASIDQPAIQRLLADGVAEGQHLDYKELGPGTTRDEKKEFLSDIVAFANSGGGDLVYGVAERRDAAGKATGIPSAIPGLASLSNADAERLRLESMIRDGIAPRVPVRITVVPGFSAGPVLVLRVPRTMNGPHLVVFERHNRFYGRGNGGKFLLGIDDIRAAFSASADVVERGFRLRDARIAAVVAGETPVPTPNGALLLLIVPPSALSGSSRIDPAAVPVQQLPLPMSGGGNNGYVAEGLVWRGDRGYSLLMRTGAIEGVYGFSGPEEQHARLLPSLKMERDIVRVTRQSLALFRTHDLPGPYHVFVALLGVRDCKLAAPTEFGGGSYYARDFDRDLLILPDIVLPEDTNADLVARFRPLFDGLWQAVGYRTDPYYERGQTDGW